jgi:hypothetical protein
MTSVKSFGPGTRFCGGWLVLPAVLFWLVAGSGCGGGKAEVDTNRFSALGTVMAQKTVPLCEGKGGVVLVVSENDKDQTTPSGLAFDAFRKALGNSVQVTATEVVQTPTVIMRGIEPLPVEKFIELLQKHSGADCLVSFVGVPLLTPGQIAQLPSPRPRVVVVVAHNIPTKAMFARQAVSLAALPKPPSDQPLAGRTAQEVFDSQYQLVSIGTTDVLLY